jgi:arylsulfatase A-like enzyme
MPSFEKKQNDKDYNIIIISATNIGTNHLGTYGYERSTSPNIDALAEESIVFDNFFAPASWTLPTGTSLFTSLYPYRHGVMERLIDAERIPSARLNADTNTLIDILKDNGYITAAFTGGFDYRPFFGLTNRFDSYTFSTGKISSKNPNMKFMENARFGHMVDVIPKALDWIKQNKRKKFFLFLQGYDTHCPFSPEKPYDKLFVNFTTENINVDPEYCYRGYYNNGDYVSFTTTLTNSTREKVFQQVNLSKKDLEFLEAQYDAEIQYVDDGIGYFIEELKKKGILNKTIIILLSEHGEMFAKHGRFGRAGTMRGTVFDDIIHVPLIILHPELEPKRTNQLAQMVDIMPTLLDFAGIPIPINLQGKSLVPVVYENKTVNEEIYGGSVYGSVSFYYYEARTINEFIRTKDFKIVHEIVLFFNGSREEKYELYDISSDKEEQYDIIHKEIEIANTLKNKLTKWSESINPAIEVEKLLELTIQVPPHHVYIEQ